MNRITFSILLLAILIIGLSCNKDDSSDDNSPAPTPTNTAPNASFSVTPNTGGTQTNFQFDASACTDNEDAASALQVRWDFETNGNWDVDWTSAKVVNHQYTQEGTYSVTMEVRDTEGLTDADTKSVTVTGGGGGNGCGGQTSLTYGGQTYDIVEIGDQCWMAENLNYETGNSWCYNNNSSNCDTYGRLYDWSTALGACPSGWHLPSDDEWDIVVNYLGGSGVAGGKMKEAGTTHWNSPNTGATNSSGFTALPGGYRDPSGSFLHLGGNGFWWSSTEYSSSNAWYRHMYYNHDAVNRYNLSHKDYGFSVRCLKD